MAAEVGVSDSTIWRCLNGRYPAPPELVVALERLLGGRQFASEIVDLIPSRNGSVQAVN